MDGSDVTVWYQMGLAATSLGNLLLARTALDEVHSLYLTPCGLIFIFLLVGKEVPRPLLAGYRSPVFFASRS